MTAPLSGPERLAAALARRTTPDTRRVGFPQSPEAIEQVIRETRALVNAEPVVDAVGVTYRRGPGKNKTVCRRCERIYRRDAACPGCGRRS